MNPTEELIRKDWLEIPHTAVAVMLDTKTYLNPEKINEIENMIKSYKTAKGLK